MTNQSQHFDKSAPAYPAQIVANPSLDIVALRKTYRETGHVRIPSILDSGAREMFVWFEQCHDWIQLIKRPDGVTEIDYSDWLAMPSKRRRKIEAAMYDNAVDGFEYCYAAMRVPQDMARERRYDPLDTFAEFMGSDTTKSLLEAITGTPSPRFEDGQATAYGTGDFLTGHDDALHGRNRTTACVFGLTPQWRLEWGGLLLFHDIGSINAIGLVPQFNTLDLFAVPRYHSVSQITRAAPRRRYAITGWLAPGVTE